MRDDAKLSTTVYRPLKKIPHPVILIRSTYGGFDFSQIEFFVKNGYVIVFQHARGRYSSEGDSYSPHRNSRSDGYDTIDWIVRQKWSSGKVGTFGYSYLGENQIMLAAANHPNHIALIADGAGGAIGSAKGSYGYFGLYENGVLNLASALGWFTAQGAKYLKKPSVPDDYKLKMQTEMSGLPVSELAGRVVPYETGFDDYTTHSLTDSWWNEEGYIRNDDMFSAAGLHVNTWYDQTVHDAFRLAELMAENSIHPRSKNQHLLIDPGLHSSASKLRQGQVFLGEMEVAYREIDFFQIYLDWYDYWLKAKEVDLPPRYQYFLIHGNQWETSKEWPPKNVVNSRYYLKADSRLAHQAPKSNTSPLQDGQFDSFKYDPLDPVPTLGGSICCTYRDVDVQGAVDQTPLKDREDVLIYYSDVLTTGMDLIGNVKGVLYVSTTGLDTDFTLKIVDEYPSGEAYNLQDGVISLRYREGIQNPQPVEPGRIYRVELELRPLAYRFRAGHRIAAYISSSNFPRLARNLNTGGNSLETTKVEVATNTVFFSEMHRSYIEVPFRVID